MPPASPVAVKLPLNEYGASTGTVNDMITIDCAAASTSGSSPPPREPSAPAEPSPRIEKLEIPRVLIYRGPSTASELAVQLNGGGIDPRPSRNVFG